MMQQSQVRIAEVGERAAGQRLDNFLLRELKGCPKSLIYRVIRKGQVRINGKRAKPDSRLENGDRVRIPPLRVADRDQPASPGNQLRELLDKRIIEDNDDFLVINKPAGMAVHGGSGIRLGLIEALRQLRSEWRDLELVHRLDRDTSGCLIIAKNTRFLRYLNKKIKEKSVTKIYLALAQGYWPDTLQEVTAPLERQVLESGERIVRVSAEGKQSRTLFRVVEHLGKVATLLEVTLDTGRTHQIRVHCRHAGHPLVGDPKYGNRNLLEPLNAVKRLALHASSVEFGYPDEGRRVRFRAPLDEDFDASLKLLRSK